ncbi:MAG: polymer-forming cytoskeletal protein, partial [Chloroflexi bacterium]|nr:polymer-forming cytoskeletal protein [Chloroflexota bacterium]
MGRGRMYKWGLVVALAIGLILMVANAASAAVFVEGRIIPVDQVIDDDVFIVGDRVVVEGTVRGNLFATGGEVLVNGTVEGSLFAMGQTVQVNGTVRGSAFTGASSVILGPTANVARNLFFGGFALDIQRGASVGQDALVGGYQAQVGGRVAGDLKAALGALEIDGEIGGDVRVDVGDPAQAGGPPPFWTPPGVARTLSPGLRVSEGARVGGKLVYTSPVRQDSAIQTQPRGGIVYQTPQPGEVR